MSRSGGCQCGAVRFRVEGDLGRASICHCRMCQKAFGSFFGPYVSMKPEQVTWTRGERKLFASSNLVSRGFCGDCGTQLTFEGAGFFDIAIGAFDDPTDIRPTIQIGLEAKLPWVDELGSLRTQSPEAHAKTRAYQAQVVSHQHPDHDT
ncbi:MULTISPECIES: GFA family protein [unclassified Phenylobacterium]|uniref:GFA family protein n=1 Tax=unclassified Phenylobacterium TaxID=2640670 RepID=UPI00083AA416|nr:MULTISPECIES: GFA family protein [unclassified Phenylobacterium]